MDSGPEPISDTEEQRRVERQARAVYVKSVIAAAAFTALSLVP
jgi:hypothetical protein